MVVSPIVTGSSQEFAASIVSVGNVPHVAWPVTVVPPFWVQHALTSVGDETCMQRGRGGEWRLACTRSRDGEVARAVAHVAFIVLFVPVKITRRALAHTVGLMARQVDASSGG